MDNREEVRAFLVSRRARLDPRRVGLSTGARHRRVPGLRRTEVADLAGVSVEYYAKIERGHLVGVSDEVLNAIARALQLDPAERAHLAALACSAKAGRRPVAAHVRPAVERLLAGMTEIPAVASNGRLDLLAANPLARALFAPVFAQAARPANQARFLFLDPHARHFWIDWEHAADEAVGLLRTAAGADPRDGALADLVDELSAGSAAFRNRWATHDVHGHRAEVRHVHHPVVGDLHLHSEVLEVRADPGLDLVVFSAEPGSPDDDALRLLVNFAAGQSVGFAVPGP